jgi:uncharacterized membrane protein
MTKTQLFTNVVFVIFLFLSCAKKEQQKDAGPITYEKNIKYIFQKKCASCHNSSWPETNWSEYDIVVKNLKKIKNRVVIQQNMPPNGMSSIDRIFIKKWIERGAPK